MITDFYNQQINSLKDNGTLRKIPEISYKKDKYIFVNGKKYLNLSSNDYLSLSTDKTLVKEFLKENSENDEFLFSSASSRLLTGSSAVYSKLENNLASLFKKEACLLFNTGYQCNLGVISALFEKKDVIFSDKLNHASIVAGIKLSQADFYRYKHLDYRHLESLLKKYRSQYKQAVIISESVFSMDGDICDIKKLTELKNKYNCLIIIDEAHAFGVFGNNLCGICEKENISNEIDIITATFGKSFASAGAFCISNKTIIKYLVNKASSFIFSTALAPVNIMWTNWLLETKLQVLKKQQKKLNILFDKVHDYLKDNGKSQIIPVILGTSQATVSAAKSLQDQGYFVLPIRPPTVPPNTSRLRLSLTADITFEEIKNLADAIKRDFL